MFRVHQFDKVEMFSFTTPETSWDEHELLVSVEEEIIGNLELPYRVVNIAAGDLGGARREEVRHRGVAPGAGALPRADVVLELHRLPGAPAADAHAPSDGKLEVLHTLNGTATAIGRTLIALLENHQRADGSVALPAKLHPYLPERARVLAPR